MDIVAKPGQMLDANIARAPWRALVVHDAEASESYLMGGQRHRVPLPHYSIDIEDAHRVVAAMKERGFL